MNIKEKFAEIFFEIISKNQATLQYTFLLNTPTVKYSTTRGSASVRKFVDACFKSTHEVCQHSGIKPSLPYFHKMPTSKSENDFSEFDSHFEFWEFIFKQHSIVSAYEKTRKLLSELNDATISTLNIRNLKNGPLLDTEQHKPSYGMSYLLTKNININSKPCASLTDACEFKCDSINADSATEFGGNYKTLHTNTTNTAKTLFANISKSNIKALKSITSSNTDYRILTALSNLEFFNCTVGNKESSPTTNLSTIYNKVHEFSKTSYENYHTSYDLICKRIENNGKSPLDNQSRHCNFTIADKIHAKNLIEEVFYFDLIDCLYQNIEASADREFLTRYLPLVSMCYNLPNTYSRHFILQMAIDNIKYNYVNDTTTEGKLVIRITEFSDDTHKTLQKLIWLDKYTRMIKSLCKITFPVYESHFFNTMWESIAIKSKTHLSTLKEMFYILNTYLDNKDNVKRLLVLNEDAITIDRPDFNKLITPFSNNECLDPLLYGECLNEFLKFAKTSSMPFFINPEHLLSLNKDTGKIIRNAYLNLSSNII